ncbi:MAG: hypothetical protein HQL44_08715 [Alphaproteobacteria bacterium]|nr:hypothetical protein [Alphaproteobacteria bacterium]
MKRYYILGSILYAFCFSAVISSILYDETKRQLAALEIKGQAIASRVEPFDKWLRNNRDVYYQGSCQAPSRPSNMCTTENDARARAVVKCGFEWQGCSGVKALLNGKGDSPIMGYIANVGCNSITADMKGESYSEANLALDTIEAIAESYCTHDDSFFSKLACFITSVSKIEKKLTLIACIKRETNECYNAYVSWKSAAEKYNICVDCVARLKSARAEMLDVDNQVAKLKRGFVYQQIGGLERKFGPYFRPKKR